MRLSWKIGRVAGIDLYIHATFLLVFLFVPGLFEGGAVAVRSVLLILSVFGCVLLHEFGHALMARRFGIETEDITLYPIGGVARLRRMPRAPGAELLIALAGPAVNFAIVAALVGLALLGLIDLGSPGDFVGGAVVRQLGARHLQPDPRFSHGRRPRPASASERFPGRARATTIAARVGRVLALLFGVAALSWPQ